jgi:CHAD domain-containing protein
MKPLLALTAEPAKSPGVQPDDPVAEAGRKVLRFHCDRMLRNEPATRLGEDIEALHDMRVATRRMRAATRIFGTFFDARAIRRHGRGLRQTATILGSVRDLDVLIARLAVDVAALPAVEQPALAPLHKSWMKQRRRARADLLEYLDSKAYRRFVARFQKFLQTPGAGVIPPPQGEIVPTQVCHLAPAQIWQHYAAVRAYETLLPPSDHPEAIHAVPIATMHALRIECKRLRYTLEFFREILPPEGDPLIAQVTEAQNHLGDLHDADVAIDLVSAFIQRRKPGARPSAADGARHLLQIKEQERTRLLDSFPALWQELIGPHFRLSLGQVVAAM